MEFGERLKEARISKGLTQEQLATKIGVAKSTLTGYEKGNREPDFYKICELVKALDVDPNYLLGVETKKAPENDLKGKNSDLITKYDSLDTHGKDLIDTVLQKEYQRVMNNSVSAKEDETSTVYLNFYNLPVSAGRGVYLDGESYDVLALPANAITTKANFALRVSGDSMEPDYHDQDIILVKTQPTVNDGTLGIFIVNGEGYFKKFKGDRLVSLNPKYEDRIVTESDEFYCMGKVIGRLDV